MPPVLFGAISVYGDKFRIEQFRNSREMREFVATRTASGKKSGDVILIVFDGETIFCNAEALIVLLSSEVARMDKELNQF